MPDAAARAASWAAVWATWRTWAASAYCSTSQNDSSSAGRTITVATSPAVTAAAGQPGTRLAFELSLAMMIAATAAAATARAARKITFTVRSLDPHLCYDSVIDPIDQHEAG